VVEAARNRPAVASAAIAPPEVRRSPLFQLRENRASYQPLIYARGINHRGSLPMLGRGF
jgi:hypothetical protein